MRFSDPSIALDAGYVQVTRLNGHGPALLVIPNSKTPLEACNPIAGPANKESKPQLFQNLTPRSITFEGFLRMDGRIGGFSAERMKHEKDLPNLRASYT